MTSEALNLVLLRIETLAVALGELSRAPEVRKAKALAKDVRGTLQRCFQGVESYQHDDVIEGSWDRALYLIEAALEREIARCQAALFSRASEGLGYFEMVQLRYHDAFTLRAFRQERFIGYSALIAQDHADNRQARIDAFLAVLGAQEVDDTKHQVSKYRGEMLEGSWDRHLITRKKPT